MKRTLALASLAALLAAPAAAQQISFKLTGGWTFIQGDDYKTAAGGQMEYLRAVSSSVSGALNPLTNAPNFQAEIITHWGKRLAVGFGGGYYQIGQTDSFAAASAGGVTTETSFKPQISAIPFFLNIHYKMTLGKTAGLDVFAGPVFQIAQFSSERNTTSTADPLSEVESFKAAVPTLGLQAGLSLSLSVGKGISVVADGLFRYEKAFNFVGNWTYYGAASTGETSGTSSEYYLWYFESAADKAYPMVGFYDANGPTGVGISNARKAELNLSGFTFSAGIKIDL